MSANMNCHRSVPKKALVTNLLSALWLGCWTGMLHGAVPGDPVDAWTQADGQGLVSFTSQANGEVMVSFGAQSSGNPPIYSSGSAVADVGVARGAFVGDYKAAGVKGLSFAIAGDGHEPAGFMLVLRARKSGRIWRNMAVNISAESGKRVINLVSMERSGGWTRDGRDDLDAIWDEDMRDVESIGVRLAQNGRESQSFTLADFVLLGKDFVTEKAKLGLLRTHFGVDAVEQLNGAQRELDGDGDGMADWKEILAGTDHRNRFSVFAAEIIPGEGDGITIRWPCVLGAKYRLFRAESLIRGFGGSVTDAPLEAEYTGYMTYHDDGATGTGPYFYKVMKQ